MSDVAAVLFVNDAFYDAFRTRDAETMERLWSQRDGVACIHPGWPALTGRDEVMRSWHSILGGEGAPDIVCREPRAFVTGETAFVICYEQIGQGLLVATNLFVREGRDWRLMHHQAGPCNAVPAEDDEPEAVPQA